MRMFAIALLLAVATAAAADTRYVDDKLLITMRTGQGNAYQILRTLPTGTALELLETSGDYARVRTQDGVEGWVLTQYLTDQPVARDRLAQAEQKLAQLQDENSALKKELAALKGDKRSIETEHKQLADSTDKLQKELAHLKEVAARPVELDQQNKEMHQRLQELELNSRVLQEENTALHDRSTRDWFLAGGGVMLVGIILGLLLPKLRRRQSGWSDWH